MLVGFFIRFRVCIQIEASLIYVPSAEESQPRDMNLRK